MTDRRRDGPDGDGRKSQLRMWDDERRETAIGSLSDGGEQWELVVLLEPGPDDLFRGCLSFRSGDHRFDTAAVLVEESAEAVVRRAMELPASMLRQLLASARG